MKNSFLQSIQEYLKHPGDLVNLAQAAGKVLAALQPQMPFVMVHYQRSAQPLSVFFQRHLALDQQQAFASLQKIYQQVGPTFTQTTIPENLDSAHSFILILPEKYLQNEQVKQWLADWRILHRLLESYKQHLLAEQNLEYGNQISQLIHDIDALMRLWKEPENEPEKIEKRLKYQQKLNQRLLFFVRDLEILKTNVKIKELVNASLDEAGWRDLKKKVEYSGITEQDMVEIDVELFNMALKETLANALKVTRNDPDKIRLKISKATVDLHFFLKEWMIVTIINLGSKINPDFLPWVKTPYFTTWKEEGHTGFGLAISQKIVEAHHGFLEINSAREGKTEVSLYWPMKDNE